MRGSSIRFWTAFQAAAGRSTDEAMTLVLDSSRNKTMRTGRLEPTSPSSHAPQRSDDPLPQRRSPLDRFNPGAPQNVAREVECRSHSSNPHLS